MYNRSINEFEKAVGIGQGTLLKIIKDESGKRKLSASSVGKISDYFKKNHNVQLNERWLLTGEGEMFISDSKEAGNTNTGLLTQLKSAWDKYIKGIGLEDEATSRANRKLVDEIMQRIDSTKDKIDKAQGK